jgi:transcriptional regulator with XRE-family HTH domain
MAYFTFGCEGITPMNTLGSRIRFLRGRLSQEVFSAQVGVSKATLGGYERDENLPNTDVALKICRQANVSVLWLLTGKNEDAAALPAGPPPCGASEVQSPAGTERHPATACRRCEKLEEKLDKLEDERRELSRENRRLWQANSEMAVRIARMDPKF